MEWLVKIIFLSCFICVCRLPPGFSQICARFEVSSMADNFIVEENSTDVIEFDIINETCSELSNLTINVDFKTEPKEDWKAFCRLIHLKKTPDCNCTKSDRGISCHVTSTFDRTKTVWRLSAKTYANSTTFTINVTYPIIIANFTINNTDTRLGVDQGDLVQAACYWKKANPPRRVVLLKENDVLMTAGFGEEEASLVVTQSAQCNNSGQYYCQVEGTDQNRSVVLVVRCPLSFTALENITTRKYEFIIGTQAELRFSIHTYTHIIHTCQLTRTCQGMTLSGTNNSVSCNSTTSAVTVSGSLPNLQLTVVLRNLTAEDEGLWCLSAANDLEPADNVSFSLHQLMTSVETTTIPLGDGQEKDESGLSTVTGQEWFTPTFTGLGVAVVAILVCSGIIVFVCHRKKQSRGQKNRCTNQPGSARRGTMVNRLDADFDEGVMIQNEIYEGFGGKPITAARLPGNEIYANVTEMRKKAQEQGKMKQGCQLPLQEGKVEVGKNDTSVNALFEPRKLTNSRNVDVRLPAVAPTSGVNKLLLEASQSLPDNSTTTDTTKNHDKGPMNNAPESTPNAAEQANSVAGHAKRSPNGLLYSQLDFSHVTPRSTIITALPNTDYALIRFKTQI